MTTEISSYGDFFHSIFGNKPFAYQEEIAKVNTDLPSLLNVPTGAGKTNAVLGAWLWRRLQNPETVGRRLIYCLPMRTLVEQTREVAKTALNNLVGLKIKTKDRQTKEIKPDDFSVHTLYGGDVSDDWDIYPEREQIIIGTQDLLLSRALNRGYAMNRFRWAFHFGLFNNDCLWVFDEVQLFGDGLATTAQLAAFRENTKTFGTFGKSNSLWMSATLDKYWLKTVDFDEKKVRDLKKLELEKGDYENETLKNRLNAVKVLQKADIECRLPKGLADFVFQKHERGTQTLIVVNTVARAQEIYAEIEKNYTEAKKQAQKSSTAPPSENENQTPEIHLLHSRFRPAERKKWQKIFNETVDESGAGRIIIATQVIEAGVDISAKLLLTDIAPFPSLVQRFGRVNRTGEFYLSEIYWIDLPLTKNREKYAATDLTKLDEKTLSEIAKIVKPYEWENIEKSRAILETIDSASPNNLRKIDYKENYTPNHVLRQRDLIDLFDTTADLSGFDLDVSRFVRGGEERDVSVYWREKAEDKVNGIKKAIERNTSQKTLRGLIKRLSADRNELCPVPISQQTKDFLKGKQAWTFDALRKDFVKVDANNLRTGMIILLDVKEGGYDNEKGWQGKPAKSAKDRVEATLTEEDLEKDLTAKDGVDEFFDDDELTNQTPVEEVSQVSKEKRKVFISFTQTLQEHSLEVRDKAEEILNNLGLPELDEFSKEIVSAAHHHDWGKAHPIFQATVQNVTKDTPLTRDVFGEILAKSESGGKHRRRKFRHELASALAMLEKNRTFSEEEKFQDLTIYLVAAHHGKVRLSIRALPDETKPFELDENKKNKQIDKKFARGIWEDDELLEVDLGNGIKFPETSLNLNALSLGKTDDEPSWLERMINLRDDLGVFRLAYLESIVRAADVQASEEAARRYAEIAANEQNSLETNEND